MEVVINKCYGGFGLSHEGIMHYAKLKGITLYPKPNPKFARLTIYWTVPPEKQLREVDNWSEMTQEQRIAHNRAWEEATLYDRNIPRDDPALVQTVKDLGPLANGMCANLRIVEIPDDTEWEINEYDGNETVDEKHRSWG